MRNIDDTVKFCKDCKHFKSFIVSGNLCRHSKATNTSLVSGRKTFEYAHRMRKEGLVNGKKDYTCGPDAKLFEPRK